MLKKMSDPALDETFVSSKPAFDGRLLHVHVDTVRLPNGRTTTREGNCRKKPGMRRTIGSIWVLLPRLRALLMK